MFKFLYSFLVATTAICAPVLASQPSDFYAVETLTLANTANNAEEVIESAYVADNLLRTGLFVNSLMDFSSESAGASFGVYSIVRGVGPPGSWGVHDIVGVHATALKEQSFWAAAMHADVYDSFPGGTSIGLNIEFPQTQSGTDTIGVNMQPHEGATGLVGLQLQHPESFDYSLIVPNMSFAFGKVDDVLFGMRFHSETQSLRFYRYLGQPEEVLVNIIPMDFDQAQ